MFDKNKLSTKYKVVPFDFAGNAEVARNGNSIRHRKYFEREEFIIVSNSRGKYLEPLDKYIHGFYVDEDLLNEVNQSDIEWMENHPLFLGYYKPSEREFNSGMDFINQMNKKLKRFNEYNSLNTEYYWEIGQSGANGTD